jgi:hypothetical protein
MALFRSVVEHTVEIAAPAAVVYRVLTTLADWPAWSTLLVGVDPGPLKLGDRLSLGLRTAQARYDFTATVTALEPDRAFEWLARTGAPGVMDGRHRFELTVLSPGRCSLRNAETYSGLLVPLMMRTAAMRAAPQGFAAMNAEIARRAEALAPSPSPQ